MLLRGIRRAFAAVVVASLVLAACGGGGDDEGDTAAKPPGTTVDESAGGSNGGGGSSDIGDGCKIVTAADGEAIFGEPLKESTGGTAPQQLLASCVWEAVADNPNSLVTKLLQFHVFDGAMFYSPDTFKTMTGFEEVDGLGDAAFVYGSPGVDLLILDGKRTISLGASGFDPNDPAFDRDALRKAMVDLGATVLDRM